MRNNTISHVRAQAIAKLKNGVGKKKAVGKRYDTTFVKSDDRSAAQKV